MRLVLDAKSLGIGVFVGAALIAGLGAMQQQEPQVGRYQVGVGERAVIVDTATGQAWWHAASTYDPSSVFYRPKQGNQP